jgi:glucose/mannose transport system permease protein
MVAPGRATPIPAGAAEAETALHAHRQRRRYSRERIYSLLLLAPSVIAIAVFVYGFIGYTAYTSLSNWDSLVPDLSWAGFGNYRDLFRIYRFQVDLRNTVTFTTFFVLACLILGFLLAVLLDQHIKGENLFRGIFLMPMAISFIVTGVAWRWLLAPGTQNTGTTGINQLLENAGLGFLKSKWFTNETVWHVSPDSAAGNLLDAIGMGFLASPKFGIPVAMLSVVLAATWQMSGYTMALYLAGMRGIPDELREAARVDGASELQIYRYIILPMLNPITLSAVIILGHISLKIFDLVVAMTGPGTGFVTDVPALFMYDTTFRGNHFNQGAGVAIVLLLSVAILIVPYLIYNARTETEQ